MDIFLNVLLFAVGVVLIVKGGDFFVDAAAWIAEISGIPKLIIGATIVSVATTLPEILVSTLAAAQGKVEMSVGNAVGSVTANIGLIMAVSLIFLPAVIKRKDYLLKSVLLISAAVLLVIGGIIGEVNLVIAILLIAVFGVFIFDNIKGAKASSDGKKAEREKPVKKTVIINILKFVFGAAGIVMGAELLVNSGSELARLFGIPERIIAVTIVAIGTSLPELVTTITAISKKHSSLSVGNVIGANIIDLTLILPLCSFVSGKPLPISSGSAVFDIPTCLFVGLIALVPALISKKFRRWQGVAMLVVYAAYITVTCVVGINA